MSSPASTTSATISQLHHGQSSIAQPNGAMDNDNADTNGPSRSAHSDVMDTSPTLTRSSSDKRVTTEATASADSHDIQAASSGALPHSSQGGQPEVDPLLRLRQKAYAPSRPHVTQDLLPLYGLSSLVSSVARSDPVTGEKINKMRRSYEGQVKTFGLAGKHKAVRLEKPPERGLVMLSQWPEEEWHVQNVSGKELEKGLSEARLAKLEKAMKLEPGLVPNNDEWENILGHEKVKTGLPMPDVTAKQPLKSLPKPAQVHGRANGVNLTVGTPIVGEVVRPKRTGRKRRYDEHSFEGYGEGFLDDDTGDMVDSRDYSSDDGSRQSGTSKKKRKKDYNAISPPTLPDRAGSYGVGMMHVSSGIGAYGR